MFREEEDEEASGGEKTLEKKSFFSLWKSESRL